jgi:hypothetical protein
MTLIRTTGTSSLVNGFYTNHRDEEAYGDHGHTPWLKSYTNITLSTRDYAVTPVQQMITSTRITRTHFNTCVT